MQLLDDDEIQRVDGTYLGPPGKYIGRVRYRVLVFFVLLAPLGLVAIDKTVGISLFPVVWTLMGAGFASGWLADHLTIDRPVTTSISLFFRELSTPREPTQWRRVRGPSKIIKYQGLAPHPSVHRKPRARDL